MIRTIPERMKATSIITYRVPSIAPYFSSFDFIINQQVSPYPLASCLNLHMDVLYYTTTKGKWDLSLSLISFLPSLSLVWIDRKLLFCCPLSFWWLSLPQSSCFYFIFGGLGLTYTATTTVYFIRKCFSFRVQHSSAWSHEYSWSYDIKY